MEIVPGPVGFRCREADKWRITTSRTNKLIKSRLRDKARLGTYSICAAYPLLPNPKEDRNSLQYSQPITAQTALPHSTTSHKNFRSL
jgi:hypothetical protein